MNLRPHRREEPDLNLVPMIDVVLVLLIFFMIATSLRHESKLEIRLPESTSQPLPSNLAQLEVDIDASGRYALNGQTLATTDASTLKAALQAAAQDRTAADPPRRWPNASSGGGDGAGCRRSARPQATGHRHGERAGRRAWVSNHP